ncbi:hypothetical protein C6P46_002192 [Rhodotorula mucilaginosa]|uniref:Cyclin-like domain-containing protein n=2 Tax=Rhodotorula mucilaginosa TaxID=5537 RepID=A0A9P6VST7_RHOMI|nr:hypothetical protein C6P46_002192 [Rhodotorula mucilaginosa]TKA50632.1 hypothetical protein B0A53_06360 [Rhodotorula sp. CCFEE 5036]
MASRHLLNPLAPLDQPTPSALDGVPPQLERDLRAYGALMIQQAGIMLKAPQVVMATAQVLFQRFWFVTSLKHFGIRDVGMGALFLASKLEESTLRIRDIINCYSYLSSLVAYCSNPPYPPPTSFESYDPMDYFATEFYDLKDALVIAEMQILKRLGFQTQCGLPYGHLVNYLQVLELTGEKQLVNRSWGFCDDMLRTPAPALYPQSTLALAAIYLATHLASIASPSPIALRLEPVALRHQVPARQKAGLLEPEDVKLVQRVATHSREKAESILDAERGTYAALYIQLLGKLSRTDTFQFILVLLGDFIATATSASSFSSLNPILPTRPLNAAIISTILSYDRSPPTDIVEKVLDIPLT